jgi:hypothetical protein
MWINTMFMGMDMLVEVYFFIQKDLGVLQRVNGVDDFSQKIKIMGNE